MDSKLDTAVAIFKT